MLGIEDDQKKRAVVASICNLGRSLGMAVAGEGVETQAHALILRAAGCTQAQGYHFGRPRASSRCWRIWASPVGRPAPPDEKRGACRTRPFGSSPAGMPPQAAASLDRSWPVC